jgi:Carboxypeptidase regulatory-like domain/CarboxypepD_reg-like domain
MNDDDRRRRRGLLLLLLPVLAVLFWFTAVWTSSFPDTFVVGVNVHGLTLNPFAPDAGQRPAPLSLSVLADAQQDTSAGSSASAAPPAPSPTPRATSAPATPTVKPIASPTPSLIALPTPSITPLPTPTIPVPTPSATTGSATIAGQVTDSQTRLAIVGASVSLSPGGATTTTDANGNFSFSVAPGAYTVTAAAPTYNAASQSVSVRGGQKATLSFRLVSVTAYGSLAGTVINSTTQAPIVGATVMLSNGLARVTDTNGAFSFSIVLNGSYTMTISAVGYVTQTQTVTIRAGKTTNVQIALVP